ncbi:MULTISPECIES: hypothetical protein [Bizionia]|uniref:Uncharacterized protein n=1 Tax=Bizionia algoritergicola TaxID=291187 RepID=A0A5D0QN26_9FLAO|nr:MULTISPECIES: hypothetical protein [Bizionia]OBX22355.1 hypothetical protein BAA08_08825 [Bizionia sp. APA-3]TYB70570.1 hypothetical protein ES675_15475 [Bizionia algoritergicola]
MIKKITLLFALFITVQSSFSQSDLNQYKYVIVPTSYEFCTERDQYQLNSLTKFLFEKQGFVALMSDEPLPQDIINNGCLALWADVLNESGIFETKFRIELKNCQKQVVFTSGIGQSREKKYKVAYNLSLRQAFESFNTLNYSYNADLATQAASATASTITKPAAIAPPVALGDQLISESKKTDATQALTAKKKDVINYELLNDKGEVVYTLIFSGKEEFYMVEGIQATVYKVNDNWVIAKTTADGSLLIHTLNVTF